MAPPVVDVHTHLYPPALMDILRRRTEIPYVRSFPLPSDPTKTEERLVILPSEVKPTSTSTAHGRPIGPEYHSIEHKISFMNTHSIDISILSLANPWLDWLPPSTAAETAILINNDIEHLCTLHPKRLYAFGTLPLSASPTSITTEIHRLATLPHHRGIVMGTSGLGSGLDDPALDPIWSAVEATQQVIFLHPHYGLPEEVYGPRAGSEYGHVLPLAMGFPMETTIAVARMWLGGVFERFPGLKVLLAHSGGTLPFLAGRIESCVAHDAFLRERWRGEGKGKGRRGIWEVLKTNVYLDAVVYGELGVKAAVEASGADRVMFGTDNPFFPPLDGEEEWPSVTTNAKAIRAALDDSKVADAVMGGNAVSVLKLDW